MSNWRTSITASKAVVLGPEVVCDGFHRLTGNRVQTHVHLDHMSDFETSLGLQRVWTLSATRALLIAELNGTLDIRSNFVGVADGTTVQTGQGEVTLIDSRHMLGSAQVVYEHGDGYRTGYSGDFAWPLDSVIQVDELVVDSTYGNPGSVRRYSQEEAEAALRDIVAKKVTNGPVYIYAWRGTLQRAITTIADVSQFPIIVEPRQFKELDVYRKYGVGIPAVIPEDSSVGKEAMHEGRFIMVGGRGKQRNMNRPAGYTITLSARLIQGGTPVLETSENSCEIALSDHADFEGTVEYVRHTGAKRVLTDNARGPHGVALALAISALLGIDARPGGGAVGFSAREWGA